MENIYNKHEKHYQQKPELQQGLKEKEIILLNILLFTNKINIRHNTALQLTQYDIITILAFPS